MKTRNEKLDSLLLEVEKKLRESFGEKVIKIILFGSYARNSFNEESDLDILVIVDDENLESYKNKRIELTNYYLSEKNILLSIIIERASTLERFKNHSPFLINVNKEGKVIYG